MFDRFLDGYRNPENELNNFISKKAIDGLEKEEAVKDKIRSSIKWDEKAAGIRSSFIESIGGLNFKRGSLDPVCTGVVDKNEYIIKKIVFQSLLHVYVTANLYIPKTINDKIPGILFSCGHSKAAKAEPKYQLAAIEFVLNGMAVLCIDPPGQGEMIQLPDRDDIEWGVYEHSYMGLACTLAGMNIARYFIWNLIRAVDYLISLDFIDENKIGACGNSGGGTQTSYLSLVDERIAAAAPGCYLNGRKQYIVKSHAHDSEQNIFNCMNFGLDYGDFISCFAPGPFRILSQQYDFFPIEGTLYSVKRAKKIYTLYGKEENIDIVIDKNMHGLSDVLRHGLMEFFVQHFMGKEHSGKINPYEYLLPEEELLCTASGQVVKEYDDALFLDELIYRDYKETRKRSGELKERIRQVFAIRSQNERPLEKRINPYDYNGFAAEKVFWLAEDEVSNAGIYISGQDSGLVTYMFFENGTLDTNDYEEDITSCLETGDVFIVDVRGTGAVKQTPINSRPYYGMHGTMHKLCSDAIMNGSSIMEMWINDILLSLTLSEKEIHAVSYGKACPALLVAGVAGERIKRIRTINGLKSFEEIMNCRGPFIPELEVFGLAENFDLDEVISHLKNIGKIV